QTAPSSQSPEAEILTLDPATLSYRPKAPVHLPALDTSGTIGDVGARIKSLFLGKDKVGAFLRRTLGLTLIYSAQVAPTIAESLDDIDRAMRWGFGWELGPFETWDAIGIREVLEAVGDQQPVPPLLDDMLRAGRNRFRDGSLPPAAPDLQILKAA